MEIDSNNQQPLPTQPSIASQSLFSKILNEKGNFLMVLGIIVVLLIIGAGIYYLNLNKNRTTDTTNYQKTATPSPETSKVNLNPNTGNLYQDIKVRMQEVLK